MWWGSSILSLAENELLCFDNFRFCDPIKFLEKNNHIFPGTFNPVHFGHITTGWGCTFEICLKNFFKGRNKLADIAHRIQMLSLVGVPVFITNATTYSEKDALFKKYVNRHYVYHIGSDAWNKCIKCPSMFENVSSEFLVVETKDEKAKDLACVTYNKVIKCNDVVRSTDIRSGNYFGVDNRVKEYIEKNNLYR